MARGGRQRQAKVERGGVAEDAKSKAIELAVEYREAFGKGAIQDDRRRRRSCDPYF